MKKPYLMTNPRIVVNTMLPARIKGKMSRGRNRLIPAGTVRMSFGNGMNAAHMKTRK